MYLFTHKQTTPHRDRRVEALYARGYTVTSAAKLLKVDPSHLWRVLRNKRVSRRLMQKVDGLLQSDFTPSGQQEGEA